jgi:hypothetical protein
MEIADLHCGQDPFVALRASERHSEQNPLLQQGVSITLVKYSWQIGQFKFILQDGQVLQEIQPD